MITDSKNLIFKKLILFDYFPGVTHFPATTACRVALITGSAGIRISGYVLVPAVRFCLVVCVAVDTTEYLVIGWIGMAVSASAPYSVMTT